MKRNNRENNLDEMQEQKLLHIERNGCWFCFWALLISFIIQSIIYDRPDLFRYVAGEWIVFMCLCLYMCISCIKNGIWDRHYKANISTNLMFSLVAAIVFGIYMFITVYKRSNMLGGSIASGIFAGGFVFVICFIAFCISTAAYKKRVQQLEEEDAE